MSRALPTAALAIGRLLVETAGGYLHNAIREAGITCEVCSAPVNPGYDRCQPCGDMTTVPLSAKADRVAAVIYAPFQTQTYTVMRGYKAPNAGLTHTQTMQMILGLALRGHIDCVISLGEGKPVRWAVVPSIAPRKTEHPLHSIVAGLASRASDEVVLRPGSSRSDPRSYDPDHFEAEEQIDGHVLLIDDSWVTGAHAQSAAAALKRAGASMVSTLVVARVLTPNWGPNPEFIKARLKDDFDPEICPWTGGGCP